MPYCPKCRCEYLEGIEICPDCDVDLVEELPLPIPEEYHDADWVELYAFPGSLYARMAIELLAKEGIPAYSQSFFGASSLGAGDGADFVGASSIVYVLEPDFERSHDVIESMTDELPGGEAESPEEEE